MFLYEWRVIMNRIHPKKLLCSKWTATAPINKEKHFIISEIEFDEEGNVVRCVIEAVMTKRERELDWHDLKDPRKWRQGWK
jgi:tryptophan-rich hypothetical protein